jgi:4-amino-4-deoxy-L-arabinose transferase-like glycosyltransferase
VRRRGTVAHHDPDQAPQSGQQHGLQLAELADSKPAEHGDYQAGQRGQPYHRRHSLMPMRALAFGGMLLLYLAFAAAYARYTPAWNNPDEPAHYVYIAHIAETGTLPVLEPGDWTPDRLEPLIRGHFPQGEATAIDFLRYEAWQPPLYYLVSAPVYRLAPEASRLEALHAFNILLGAASLMLAYLVARAFFAGPGVLGAEQTWLPVLVAGALVGVPMFAATSAAINNDNLANVFGGLLTLMLLRALSRPLGTRSVLLLGVVLGLGVLTKLTLGFFLPLAVAALVVGGRRDARRQSVLLLVAMLVVLSPWLVRQGLTYGWDDLLAKRRHDAILIGRAFPSLELSYWLGWGTRLFRSAWALFGWMQVPTSEKVYQVWSAVCQLGLVGMLVYVAWRKLERRALLLVAVVAGAFATVVYYNLSTDVQPQGRFLYVALAALITLLALGWSALLPPRLRIPGLAALDVLLVGLNAYTLAAFLRPAFGT